jgi:hypothetical protein
MRMLLSLIPVLLAAVPAYGQDAGTRCHPVSPTDRVVVTTTDGGSIRGTLLCLSSDEVVLARDGATTRTPLQRVTRIETRPDPVWDGAAKGGIIPIVFWLLFCHECDAEPMLRAAAGYGLIGLTWDSLDRNTKTIYAGGPRPTVAWRIRF